MKTNKHTLLTAIFIAMALTFFSCSSGGGGNKDDDGDVVGGLSSSSGISSPSSSGGASGGGISFNENSQIFNDDGSAYTGNGVIKMRFFHDKVYNCESLIDVGSVTNGIVTLASTIPTPPEECLVSPEQPSDFQCSSYFSNDAKATDAEFQLYEGEEFIGFLFMLYEYGELEESIRYGYVSEEAAIICNGEFEKHGYAITINIKENVQIGWNKMYRQTITTSNSMVHKSSSDNILTKELKWISIYR